MVYCNSGDTILIAQEAWSSLSDQVFGIRMDLLKAGSSVEENLRNSQRPASTFVPCKTAMRHLPGTLEAGRARTAVSLLPPPLVHVTNKASYLGME